MGLEVGGMGGTKEDKKKEEKEGRKSPICVKA